MDKLIFLDSLMPSAEPYTTSEIIAMHSGVRGSKALINAIHETAMLWRQITGMMPLSVPAMDCYTGDELSCYRVIEREVIALLHVNAAYPIIKRAIAAAHPSLGAPP